MYTIIQQGDSVSNYVLQVVVDIKLDIEQLPTKDWNTGSSAICLEDSSVWMLGNDKKWHEI